jgi:hypothetical protein
MVVQGCRKKSLSPGEVSVDVKGGVVERIEGMDDWQLQNRPRRQWVGDDGLEEWCVQGCEIGASAIHAVSEASARLEAAKERVKPP